MSIWRWPSEACKEWQLRLYDEMCSRHDTSPMIEVTKTKAISYMGLPFNNLRCLWWSCINNVLLQAEDFEHRSLGERTILPLLVGNPSEIQAFLEIVNKYPPGIQEIQTCIDVHLAGMRDKKLKCQTYEQWRKKILDLRSEHYEPPQSRSR